MLLEKCFVTDSTMLLFSKVCAGSVYVALAKQKNSTDWEKLHNILKMSL